jgi:hypothetical protein
MPRIERELVEILNLGLSEGTVVNFAAHSMRSGKKVRPPALAQELPDAAPVCR